MCALRAKLAADANAVLAGQHQVENDQVETIIESQLQAERAAVGKIQLVALVLEILANVRGDVGVVFNNENFHNRSG